MSKYRKIKVTAIRNGKKITYERTITPKVIKSARRNIKKARKVWLSMSSRQRKIRRKNSPITKARYKLAFG